MDAERWQQVKAIFNRAVERDPATRAEFLRESCGSDEELRREVESLLESEENHGSLLANPVIEAGAMAAAAPARSVDPLIGRTIGNYVLTGELARGGMGIVYRARHVTLPRDAVVKCIRTLAVSEEAQKQQRARFRREAHIQSQLDHPHVVRVYEFFDFAEEYFLVMEYVPGSSVRSMLDESGRLPPERAAALAAQALEGLAHAHSLHYVDESGNNGVGIIHRDIKPGNLLVDEQGNLKLTDFGIAKVRGDHLTKTGFSPGTVDYMSPEQIRGLPVDARSDLYSLGATLYQMLTGRVPFPRTDSDSGYDLLKAHVETDPPPIQTLSPEIPSSFADVVTRSLNRDPEQRWQTAVEFREALISHQQALMSGPQPAIRRRVMAAGMAALTLTAVLAGAFWLGRGAKSSRPAQNMPSIAVLPFADLSPEKNLAYFGDGMAEELRNRLARIERLRVTGRTSSLQFKGKAEDSRVIGRKLNVATILEGSVRRQGSRARISVQLIKPGDGSQLWSETYDREMNDIFAVEDEIADAVTGALKIRLLRGVPVGTAAKSTSIEAYNSYLQARYFYGRRNKLDLKKAADYFVQAIRLDPAYARAWAGLGQTRVAQADRGYVPETEGYRQGQEAVQRALDLDPDLAEAHAAMGSIRKDQYWDWTGANASYQRALALAPGNASVVGGAGDLDWVLGRLNEAVTLYRRAIEIDPLDNNLYLNVGLILDSAGRQEEARVALAKALELVPETDGAHFALCRIYLAQSHPQQALAEAEKEKHTVFRLLGLALAYYALGRRESDTNLAELIAKFAVDNPYQIADGYAFRGETDKAFEWLERAYGARDPGLIEIKGDPLLIKLKSDPRYAALLKKMRLPL